MSVIWTAGDGDTLLQIVQTHHAAVAELVKSIEQKIAPIWVIADSSKSAVAQLNILGSATSLYHHCNSQS